MRAAASASILASVEHEEDDGPWRVQCVTPGKRILLRRVGGLSRWAASEVWTPGNLAQSTDILLLDEPTTYLV